MRAHKLKCWPKYFEPIWTGRRTTEIRRYDRDYRVGDVLVLEEFAPKTKTYTDRKIHAYVHAMTFGGRLGFCWVSPTEVPDSPEIDDVAIMDIVVLERFGEYTYLPKPEPGWPSAVVPKGETTEGRYADEA